VANRVLAVVVLLVAVVYLIAAGNLPEPSFGDPVGPRMFPYLIGGFGVVTAVWLFAESVSRPAEGSALTLRHPGWIAFVVVSTAIFYAALEPLGFLLACTAYLFVLMTAFKPDRWLVNAVVAVGFAVLAELLFDRALRLPLPPGLFSI
jgi:putative tricarboxylic transport membrane protein